MAPWQTAAIVLLFENQVSFAGWPGQRNESAGLMDPGQGLMGQSEMARFDRSDESFWNRIWQPQKNVVKANKQLCLEPVNCYLPFSK